MKNTFEELYAEICSINELEPKDLSDKILKFNEEFGEFVAEVIKFKGGTYKKYNKRFFKICSQ